MVKKYIKFEVSDYEFEHIQRISKETEFSYRDLFLEPFLANLDDKEEDLKEYITAKQKARAYKRRQAELKQDTLFTYHFANAYQRILSTIGKRINTQDTDNNNIQAVIYYLVEKTLDNYHELPETIKKILEPEKNKFEMLLTPHGIDEWIASNHYKIKRVGFKCKKLVDLQ